MNEEQNDNTAHDQESRPDEPRDERVEDLDVPEEKRGDVKGGGTKYIDKA